MSQPQQDKHRLSGVSTRLRALLLLASAVSVFDYLTKGWMANTLVYGQPVPVLGDSFRLMLGENSGVAFGLLANTDPLPAVISFVVILALTLATLGGVGLNTNSLWPLGLVLGGALGNLLDRLGDGTVTDFLDFGVGGWRWPSFNLADTFIVVGILFLVFLRARETPGETP